MSGIIWSTEHNLFIKSCPQCKKIYLGKETKTETENILHKYFSFRIDRQVFSSQCRKCDVVNKRKRRGVIGTYNIAELLHSQNDQCAICHSPLDLEQAEVDDDHKTGKVRGILCTGCNRGLGQFHDSLFNLESALAYLRKYTHTP